VLRHGAAVAAYEERFLGRGAQQGAVDPLVVEKVAHSGADVCPEPLAVRLEHRPLRAAVDRGLEVQEIAAHVDVLPLRVARQRPRAPYPDAAVGQGPKAVDAERIEHFLLAEAHIALQAQGARHRFVRRSLEYTALDVAACIDSADEARGR